MFSALNSARQAMSTRFGSSPMQVHTAATLPALVTVPRHIALLVFALAPVLRNSVPSNAPSFVLQGGVLMVVLQMLHNCILEVLQVIRRASAWRRHMLYEFPIRLNPAVTMQHGRYSPFGFSQCLHRHNGVPSLPFSGVPLCQAMVRRSSA
jgi:hypothetical protein